MKKQLLTVVFVLALLALSLIEVYAVRAQYAQSEQLTVSISPSGTIEALGVYFTSVINGGTPPYSLQWYCNNIPIEGATTSQYSFSPTSSGTYSIYAIANDSQNTSATSNTTTVTAKQWLQIDLANHNYLTYSTVGQLVQFSATVTDGTPPYRYQWYYQPYYFGNTPKELSPIGDTIEGSASQNFTFVANSVGHYLISVRVWDSQNNEGYFMSLPPGIWLNVAESTPSPSQSPSATPSSSPLATPSITLTPTLTATPMHTASLSPEPTLSPSPNADNIQGENYTSIVIIFGLVIMAVMMGVLVYFKKRRK